MNTQTETPRANGGAPTGRIILPAELDWPAIRDRLAAAMKDAGLSMRGLAEAAHIGSHATLSTFLSAKTHELDLATLAAIAMALEVTVEDLAGLDPAPAEGGERAGDIVMLAIDEIDTGPLNPRKTFDDEKQRLLVEDIEERGLQQNLVARAREGGRYELVSGERRLRAVTQLRNEGCWPADRKVPVKIVEATDSGHVLAALAENLQREDLSPLEEAVAFHTLQTDYGLSAPQIAEELKITPRTVEYRLALLKLTATAREALAQGMIPAAAARHLPRLTDLEQNKLIEAILSGDLLPHETRVLNRVRAIEASRKQPAGGDEPEQLDIEDVMPPRGISGAAEGGEILGEMDYARQLHAQGGARETDGNTVTYDLRLGGPYNATIECTPGPDGWDWQVDVSLPESGCNVGRDRNHPLAGREAQAVLFAAAWLARYAAAELGDLDAGERSKRHIAMVRQILAWANGLIEARGGEAVPEPEEGEPEATPFDDMTDEEIAGLEVTEVVAPAGPQRLPAPKTVGDGYRREGDPDTPNAHPWDAPHLKKITKPAPLFPVASTSRGTDGHWPTMLTLWDKQVATRQDYIRHDLAKVDGFCFGSRFRLTGAGARVNKNAEVTGWPKTLTVTDTVTGTTAHYELQRIKED